MNSISTNLHGYYNNFSNLCTSLIKKKNRKLTHLTWLMWVILGLKIGKIKPFFYFALSDINEIGKIKPFLYFAFSDINALQALFYFYLYWYLNCSHIVKVYCH